MEGDDSLVRRRSRRSTAGNRMEAALAELSIEDTKDEVEDHDFLVAKEEEDVFESDFESTDEEAEAAQQAPEIGEKLVQVEERREKQTVRSRVERATAAAHARQKVTFNPEAYDDSAEESASAAARKRRRVSLGLAIDAETGEVINNAQRQSRRSHTILNTSATAQRMKKDAEDKKLMPKKLKVKIRALTQDELIARALDMEEGNIVEHKNYLSVEEEKRKRAHAVRTVITGPLLRWVSRRETAPVLTETEATPDDKIHPSKSPAVDPPATSESAQPTDKPNPMPVNELPKAETVAVAKNYVVHELSQEEPVVRPLWKDTMAAMFGDHVKWEDLKVYASRGRPLTRPVQTCPITGRPARYLDPRTNVPYATPAAYQTLTMILKHEYVWSHALGCYVTRPDATTPSQKTGNTIASMEE
ncbi:YL1 nuclear protein-domain-containing protein [Gloeopeniophorella convolvens]|nr:YL1 nuclear protein-domain-containing protein [Gloeopeniophorella convolvens]